MKLLIKLALAALIANAGYRIGNEYLAHIKFREAVRDVAMYRSRTDDDLRVRIGGIASEFAIPQDTESLQITRQERHVVVRGSYQKEIEVVPSYKYPWTFNWELDVMMPAVLPYFAPGK